MRLDFVGFVRSAVIGLSIFFVCLAFSALIALGFYSIVFYLIIIITVSCVFVVSRGLNYSAISLVFYIVLGLFFLNGVVVGIGLPINAFFQLILALMGLLGFFYVRNIFSNRYFYFSFVLFGLFLVFAVASTLLNKNAIFEAALFQFFSNFKYLIFILAMVYLGQNIDFKRLLPMVVWSFIVISVVFVLLQWLAQPVYIKIMGIEKINVEVLSYLPSPARGFFSHPSFLAAAAAGLFTFVLALYLNADSSFTFKKIALFFLFCLLLASNQRQEMFSAFFVAALIIIVHKKEKILPRLFFILSATLVFVGLFVFIFYNAFLKEATEWGLSGYHVSVHPRQHLYAGSFQLADKFFPFGSGLGTWGGVGALKYNLYEYYNMGFQHHWWWREYNAYLLDTFWPNPIAEAGYLGFVFLFFSYLLFIFAIYRQSLVATNPFIRACWLSSAAGFLFVFFTAFTSPAFQEVLLLFIPAMLFSAAINYKEAK